MTKSMVVRWCPVPAYIGLYGSEQGWGALLLSEKGDNSVELVVLPKATSRQPYKLFGLRKQVCTTAIDGGLPAIFSRHKE
jgi:hypothetical protein